MIQCIIILLENVYLQWDFILIKREANVQKLSRTECIDEFCFKER